MPERFKVVLPCKALYKCSAVFYCGMLIGMWDTNETAIFVDVGVQLDRDGLHDLNVKVDWQHKGSTYWVSYAHVELLSLPSTSGCHLFITAFIKLTGDIIHFSMHTLQWDILLVESLELLYYYYHYYYY